MESEAFLELARELSERADSEAALRTSVNRSYFALFNSMASFIEAHGERMPKSDSKHETVRKYLFECGISEVRKLSTDLHDLRRDRNEADYDLKSYRFTEPNTAPLLFFKARRAFNSFRQIIKNGNKRKRIMNGIEEYKRKIQPS